MIETRWCPHCQAERPLTEFYVNKAAASGVDGYCKEYRKQQTRERTASRKAAKVAAGKAADGRATKFRVDDDGRQCIKCGRYQPWVEFHLDRTATTGHQTRCKTCVRERQAALASTEEGRAASRRRTADHRARKRGPEWTPRQATRHAQIECDGTQHRCTACGELKPVEDFPRNKQTPCGFDPRCSMCRHIRRVERRAINYNDILDKERLNWSLTKNGITAEDYVWLLRKQNGGCALCGVVESVSVVPSGVKSRLSVDHDHSHCGPNRACKDCIRGLLCHDCNFGLGKFEYKMATRVRFADYLDQRPFADMSF